MPHLSNLHQAIVMRVLMQVTEVPPFSADANAVLDKLAEEFSVEDAQQVGHPFRSQGA